MRKCSLLILAFVVGVANAAENPFLGDAQNQVALHIGQGIDCGYILPPPTRFVPFTFLHFQYSQPTTFFKIPARQSFNLGQTIGMGKKYGWDWDRYTIPMIFLSEDVALYSTDVFYFSVGAGGGLQAKQNRRLGSKWLFQFKLAAGYHVSDKWGIEAFMQHFSNGNTAKENYSYAFYGLGVTYSF